MDVTPLISKDLNYITSYNSTGFRINEEWVDGSLILTSTIMKNWDCLAIDHIQMKDFDTVDASKHPEVILLGTGKVFKPLSQEIANNLIKKNIFVEVMDTSAACRTYNVLLSEGRNVLAMLIQAK